MPFGNWHWSSEPLLQSQDYGGILNILVVKDNWSSAVL